MAIICDPDDLDGGIEYAQVEVRFVDILDKIEAGKPLDFLDFMALGALAHSLEERE